MSTPNKPPSELRLSANAAKKALRQNAFGRGRHPTVGDVSLLQMDPRDALFRAHRTVHIGGCSV